MLTIRKEQMDLFARERLAMFIPELMEYLRQEAPKLSARYDTGGLKGFCERCTNFGIEKGLHLKVHLTRLALCMLKLEVDFESTFPPKWVIRSREEGGLDDDAWIQDIYMGIQTNFPGTSQP